MEEFDDQLPGRRWSEWPDQAKDKDRDNDKVKEEEKRQRQRPKTWWNDSLMHIGWGYMTWPIKRGCQRQNHECLGASCILYLVHMQNTKCDWEKVHLAKKCIFKGKRNIGFFSSQQTIISCRPNGSNGAAICCLVPAFCHCTIYWQRKVLTAQYIYRGKF